MIYPSNREQFRTVLAYYLCSTLQPSVGFVCNTPVKRLLGEDQMMTLQHLSFITEAEKESNGTLKSKAGNGQPFLEELKAGW